MIPRMNRVPVPSRTAARSTVSSRSATGSCQVVRPRRLLPVGGVGVGFPSPEAPGAAVTVKGARGVTR